MHAKPNFSYKLQSWLTVNDKPAFLDLTHIVSFSGNIYLVVKTLLIFFLNFVGIMLISCHVKSNKRILMPLFITKSEAAG